MSAGYELSSCIEWQFTECGELDARLRAASDAGFTLAEFHLWRDKPVDALAEALADTGMRLTSICVDPRKSIVDPNERPVMVDSPNLRLLFDVWHSAVMGEDLVDALDG